MITSIVMKACASVVSDASYTPLALDTKHIWNDKMLEFDLRGHCEVKTFMGKKTAFVQSGEVKSSLSTTAKGKASTQLTIRVLAVAVVMALCDKSITNIEEE